MDDKDILILYNSGEREQAFNILMRTYSERLYWLIRNIVHTHEETDDVLQTTWIKVWNALDTFREDARLYTWLYRIATNEALTSLKKSRVRAFLSFSDYSEKIEGNLLADETFSGDKLQLALQKAIAKLPPKQKAVFTLRYFDEMPYEEIAAIIGSSVTSLKTSFHYAREKILKDIDKNCDI